MPTVPPTNAEVTALAARYGFTVNDQAAESFRGLITSGLDSYNAVERLYHAQLAPTPQREYRFPTPEQNPLAAWYVRTNITDTSAAGPLAGRAVAIKDNIAVAGVPMMNGSRTIEGYVPRTDATVTTRVLNAGARIVGKAVCEDLCFSGGSFTAAGGPVHNPWDTSRMTGGSSAGCGALVADGEVDLAVGGDQGGSVRMPAAFCGIVGHKPTHGLVPYTGAFPIESTLDHLGPMTATVDDAAVLLQALAGDDHYDPRQRNIAPAQDYSAAAQAGLDGLRIGIVEEGFGWQGLSEPDVDEAVLTATRTLAAAGATVTKINIPWHLDALHVWNVIGFEGATNQLVDGNGFGMNSQGRYDPELIEHYARGRAEHGDALADVVKFTAMNGRYTIDRYGGQYYAMARELAHTLAASYDEALSDVDVLVMPTVPYVARPIPNRDISPEEHVDTALSMLANTATFNVTGHPATSVPVGLVSGMPTGMMIVGPQFDDARCFTVAGGYEAAVGGFPRPNRT